MLGIGDYPCAQVHCDGLPVEQKRELARHRQQGSSSQAFRYQVGRTLFVPFYCTLNW